MVVLAFAGRPAHHTKCAGALVAVLLAVAAMGCTREPKVLEPRMPPPRSSFGAPPGSALPPIPPGFGRVELQTTEGSMHLTARADVPFAPPGSAGPPSRSGELCTTPCIVDLPPGHYRLFLSSTREGDERGDVADLYVAPGVQHWIRAPGRYESAKAFPPGPIALLVAGAVAMTLGSALIQPDSRGGASSNTSTGLGLVLGGAALSGLGGLFYYDQSRAIQQDGATTYWRDPQP